MPGAPQKPKKPPKTRAEMQEELRKVRRQKNAAIKEQDFFKAAKLRAKETRLCESLHSK
ncbi:MAG TPA: UvrB/UvrC motif-containing protein [Candidatus Obscuribacterales bacterium]